MNVNLLPTWICWSIFLYALFIYMYVGVEGVTNDNRYFFRWSHGWYLRDVSGKAMRVRNRGYFVRMLLCVMCYGMLRLYIEWESSIGDLGERVRCEWTMFSCAHHKQQLVCYIMTVDYTVLHHSPSPHGLLWSTLMWFLVHVSE